MLHPVIMAGGSGTRFWPASRHVTPKQLLNLVGPRSMIQATVDRLGDLAPPQRTLVMTNVAQADAIRAQLPQLDAASVVAEPCKRDTAPCIGLAALCVSRDDPDATMAVMPSDHVIAPDATFQQAIRDAADLVDARPGRIVTFGIPPTYPAETFGYIERGVALEGESGGVKAFEVVRFREKPDAATARGYVDAGTFYWNAGIFVWKARTILEALERHQPEMFARLETIGAALGSNDFPVVLEREFAAIEGISIDYAVMEHARDIAVIEAPFEWDDLGSWRAIGRLRGTDADGNTIDGKHLGIDTRDTIVRTTDDHLVVTLGIENCIVVHTPGATLVADKSKEEEIRKVVQQLKERGWEEYL